MVACAESLGRDKSTCTRGIACRCQPANPPPRFEIIAAIRKVAEHMETVGAAMDYYGGFDAEVAAHGREMIGAAQIARTWADGMEEE